MELRELLSVALFRSDPGYWSESKTEKNWVLQNISAAAGQPNPNFDRSCQSWQKDYLQPDIWRWLFDDGYFDNRYLTMTILTMNNISKIRTLVSALLASYLQVDWENELMMIYQMINMQGEKNIMQGMTQVIENGKHLAMPIWPRIMQFQALSFVFVAAMIVINFVTATLVLRWAWMSKCLVGIVDAVVQFFTELKWPKYFRTERAKNVFTCFAATLLPTCFVARWQ